ncbi:uncharacterized protein LOC120475499 isoform X2 [Pimephales promelas]|uniref:uncharacterized protein LOC120475499 isoform X2 n=1 Tax=Pimephales promelas TaxID=90988 RepID=UPI0019554B38|nr:uncharacterized protein LOC120475499 isoform X2 [Pimephales promelas]
MSYGNMKIPRRHGMDREDDEEGNIYANTDPINSLDVGEETENLDTNRHQKPQHTGSVCVKIRSSRTVCLVLLCVLLLTAVVVLCVHIHTKSTNYTEERDGLLMKNRNLTNERDQLRNHIQSHDGWTYYKSSLYYMTIETKSWNASRRFCRERGADLIIINNTEKQDFVKNVYGTAIVWIGLTDHDAEGRWKWVDDSTLSSGFWATDEPNGHTLENCVVNVDHNRSNLKMDREDEEEGNIYDTDTINSLDVGEETENPDPKRYQLPYHTGSVCVKIRSSRTVCLVLLCVLLLTAVVVLCVHIHTKSTNYTEERDGLLMKNRNLTNERDQLRNHIQSHDGWTYYKSSLYYMTIETKSWDASRRFCRERGADLIIINNTEKQDFVKNVYGTAIVWIGLTDHDAEGRWKWVDDSTLSSGFWATDEPNGHTLENCVVNVDHNRRWPTLSGWLDISCYSDFKGICEKRTSHIDLVQV